MTQMAQATEDALKERIEARKKTVNSRFRNDANTRCPDCNEHKEDLRRVHHHLSCFNQKNQTLRVLKYKSKFVVDDNNKKVLQNACSKNIRTNQQILKLLNMSPRGKIFESYDEAQKKIEELRTPLTGDKTISLEEYNKIQNSSLKERNEENKKKKLAIKLEEIKEKKQH